MPFGTLDLKCVTDYCYSPVDNLYTCFPLRVLKHRFPFRCIEVDDYMIEKMEKSLQAHSLEEHFDIMTNIDVNPPLDIVNAIYWLKGGYNTESEQ